MKEKLKNKSKVYRMNQDENHSIKSKRTKSEI
jgi:hypothetical protein